MGQVTTNVRGWSHSEGCGNFACDLCYPDEVIISRNVRKLPVPAAKRAVGETFGVHVDEAKAGVEPKTSKLWKLPSHMGV